MVAGCACLETVLDGFMFEIIRGKAQAATYLEAQRNSVAACAP